MICEHGKSVGKYHMVIRVNSDAFESQKQESKEPMLKHKNKNWY